MKHPADPLWFPTWVNDPRDPDDTTPTVVVESEYRDDWRDRLVHKLWCQSAAAVVLGLLVIIGLFAAFSTPWAVGGTVIVVTVVATALRLAAALVRALRTLP